MQMESFVLLEVEWREAIATLAHLNLPLVAYKVSGVLGGSYIASVLIMLHCVYVFMYIRTSYL